MLGSMEAWQHAAGERDRGEGEEEGREGGREGRREGR
jgi:hypothetical protein